MADVDLSALRGDIATACRIMAHRGLVEDILGHIGFRVDDEHILVRCRGPVEAGLRFTTAADIRLVAADTGRVVDDPDHRYDPPNELPIHTSVLAARPDVACVVHAHPPAVVAVSLAGLELLPIVGAYNIPAARMAADGIPTHPRSILIRTPALGSEMVASLGSAPALVLTGHGLVTVGGSVAEAVLAALHVDALAGLTLAVHQAGREPRSITDTDLAGLPDLGPGFNQETLWRHHLAALAADGWADGVPGGRSEEPWN